MPAGKPALPGVSALFGFRKYFGSDDADGFGAKHRSATLGTMRSPGSAIMPPGFGAGAPAILNALFGILDRQLSEHGPALSLGSVTVA